MAAIRAYSFLMAAFGALRTRLLVVASVVVAGSSVAAAADVQWSLTPVNVLPGGELSAIMFPAMGGCTPATPVTSPGLAAPINWSGQSGRLSGLGHALKAPGTYTATFTCASGQRTSRAFTVIGPASPPSPSQPPPNGPPPQVPVKPVGAPQTGDGTLAP